MSEPLARLRAGWPAAAVDALLAAASYVIAYRLRFEGDEFRRFLALAIDALPLIGGTHLLVLGILRLYATPLRALWPLRIVTGTAAGTAIGTIVSMVLLGPEGISRQAVIAYGFLFVLLAVGWRAIVGLRLRWLLMTAEPGAGGEALEVRDAHHRTISGGLVLVYRYRELLRNLVSKDLKLKYRGSVLGFLWSLLNPLVMIVVYTFAFTYVLGVETERYSFFVLLGLLAWNFFAGSVMGSTDSVAGGGSLLKSVLFPRVILPLSGVLFNLVQYCLTLVVFLPLLIAWHGIPLGRQMLLFPVFLTLNVLFVVGIALMVSTATVFFRDLKHLVEVGLNIAFWATPILYELSRVPEQYRFVLLLSPMAPFILAYQDLFYYLTWPDVSVWLIATGYGVGAFVCGISVFVVYEDRFSEWV